MSVEDRALVRAWCHCWGLVEVVAWEIGTPCTRCGCVWISAYELEVRRQQRRAELGL